MISYITGKIIDLNFTNVTILTNSGVGYDIGINELAYSRISFEEEISLYIYHQITESNQALFGFLDKTEKRVFSELLKISGVGGKGAMQILGLGIERLLLAVKGSDYKTIEGIKGVGKKMAEKIILEMKDKDFGINFSSKENVIKANYLSSDLHVSMRTTLSNMGYNPRDIDRVLSELPEGMKDAETIIPYIIKNLS